MAAGAQPWAPSRAWEETSQTVPRVLPPSLIPELCPVGRLGYSEAGRPVLPHGGAGTRSLLRKAGRCVLGPRPLSWGMPCAPENPGLPSRGFGSLFAQRSTRPPLHGNLAQEGVFSDYCPVSCGRRLPTSHLPLFTTKLHAVATRPVASRRQSPRDTPGAWRPWSVPSSLPQGHSVSFLVTVAQ